ncbi:MAG: LacI family DNA-binding transcriptional regulator [Lachnospiraceae bacterium]|nr:LacI family transcriptional regulator [Robinsoniella sp.]MDY3766781.1 LacI family DNA-binding transcriptional regulator [Lachnospiraceae bacterium]
MITIKEMADLAGVSPTTVSNVLHGRTRKMSKETLEKVQNVIRDSNYVSNMGARLLANHGSRIIGVVLGYDHRDQINIIQDPFTGELIGALEHEISRQGYFMMLYRNPNVEKCLQMAMAWNIEGLVMIGFTEETYYAFRERLSIPIVTIDHYFQKKALDFRNVGLQDYEGGYSMGQYLISQGHRRICFCGNWIPMDSIDEQRYQGFLKAVENAGVEKKEILRMDLSTDTDLRMQMMARFAEKKFDGCTALFFTSDYIAIEAINLFYDMGIRVPDDISVAGFDDILSAKQIRPQLTTIHQNVSDKAKWAVCQVIRMCKGDILGCEDIRLPVELVIRGTVKKIR